MDDPICTACQHARSAHDIEPPYLCEEVWHQQEDGEDYVCACPGFSYAPEDLK